MISRFSPIIVGLLLLLIGSEVNASSDNIDDFTRPARPNIHQTPQDYFQTVKDLTKSGGVHGKHIQEIWKFRYLKGVDGTFLRQQAALKNVKLDDSVAGKLQALRLFIGSHDNYGFYGKTLPLTITCTSMFFNFLAGLVTGPLHVPEGTKILYAVFHRASCGGEAGPVCPSTLLAQSLPKELVTEHWNGFTGRFAYLVAGVATPGISAALLIERNNRNFSNDRDYPKKMPNGYKTVEEANAYLATVNQEYAQRRKLAIAYGVFLGVFNVVGIKSTMDTLTGTVAGHMFKPDFFQFLARFSKESCALAIDRVTTIPCNTAFPYEYIENSDIYMAGTRIIQANVMDALPYMMPTFVTLLYYMVYWLRLF